MYVRIFSRYIAKSLLTFFAGVVGVLAFVIFMNHFIRVLDIAMTYGTSWGWIISSLLNILPDVFCLSAPMAFQIAILLTLTNMSEQGELIALRAAGFSFKEMVQPLLVCALILSMLLVIMNNWLTPRSYKQFVNRREEAYSKITKVTLEPKTFINLGDWDLYLDELDPSSDTARMIHLVNKNDTGALSTKVNASSGKIVLTDTAIGLQLEDGQMQRVDNKDPSSIIAANFDSYTMSISLLKERSRRLRVGEMTTTKLLRRLRKDPLTPALANEFRTAISMRNVLAFSPLILLFVSCPIAFSLGKRTNKGWGMLLSVVIIFSFYLLMTLGLSLGKKYAWISYPGPWLPVLVGLVAGTWLWKKRLNI
ncbi:MAG: LptF/LptG family permease [Elusimicrobiaceae bacterium]|nr:LptF/LptG family permease [Elusimicrobiaceae bacterium]